MSEYTPTRQELIAAWIIAHQEEGWGGQVDMGGSPKERIAEAHRGIAEVERAAAEKLEAELEARIEDRDYWYKIATEAKDQRDAAQAAAKLSHGFLEIEKEEHAETRVERDAALPTIAKVREAVSGHPECDRYEDGDAITCGWKNAYASVVRALGSVPSTGEGNE